MHALMAISTKGLQICRRIGTASTKWDDVVYVENNIWSLYATIATSIPISGENCLPKIIPVVGILDRRYARFPRLYDLSGVA